jgi:leader peptidase (prepilin peptidase)/N-methyltransferase
MPSAVAIVVAAAVGLLGGLFTPLVAYRLSVEAGRPPRDSCAGCDEPVTGWVGAPGRCAQCGYRLGPPALVTASIGALAGGLLGWTLGPGPDLVLFLAFAVLAVLLAAIDLACLRLPDTLVIPSFWVASALLTLLALGTGRWPDLLRAGLAAATLGALFLMLAILPGAGLGYGDVKLAALLGLLLGWLGWGSVLLGGLLPWLFNGVVVIGLLLAGRVHRKSHLPFGPAMLAGSLAAVVLAGAVG